MFSILCQTFCALVLCQDTIISGIMQGTEVPNPRQISARDCTCVLTRNTYGSSRISVKSARKAKDKLHRACERASETRERTLHGQEQTECAWQAWESHETVINFIVNSANYTLLIERQDHRVHMSSVLQVQQLHTAGIPLLEAYLLPMANRQ